MFSLEFSGQFFSNFLKKAKEFKTNLPKYYNWKLLNFVRNLIAQNCLLGVWSRGIENAKLNSGKNLRGIWSRGIENAKLNSEKSLRGIWNRGIWNCGIVRAELDCEIKTKKLLLATTVLLNGLGLGIFCESTLLNQILFVCL